METPLNQFRTDTLLQAASPPDQAQDKSIPQVAEWHWIFKTTLTHTWERCISAVDATPLSKDFTPMLGIINLYHSAISSWIVSRKLSLTSHTQAGYHSVLVSYIINRTMSRELFSFVACWRTTHCLNLRVSRKRGRNVQSLVWHIPSRIPSLHSELMKGLHDVTSSIQQHVDLTWKEPTAHNLTLCFSIYLSFRLRFESSLHFQTNLSFSFISKIKCAQVSVWSPSWCKFILPKDYLHRPSHDLALIFSYLAVTDHADPAH